MTRYVNHPDINHPDINHPEKIKVGISACLLGQEVRFDGGHQRDNYITEVLGKYFTYIPLCPEVAIGLGVPRSSLRLINFSKDDLNPQAVMPKTGKDHTAELQEFAKISAPKLNKISGYILKKKSPSCGLERVKIYNPEGMPVGHGMGVYARELISHLPLLPMEEEGRLYDLRLRENFIKRVYLYSDWQNLCEQGLSFQALLHFHTRHKLLLIAHHYGHNKLLGKLIANLDPHIDQAGFLEVANQYIQLFMQTIKKIPDRRHHGQVLERIMVRINQHLESKKKEDLLKLIQEYLSGSIPLSIPIRMIRHYLTAFDEPNLEIQSYLNPYPEDLGLMNGV